MAENEDRVDAMFHALADRTRRDILRRVLAGEHSVSALAAAYDMSFAAVQKHVAVLERAGLVVKRRVGREALASGDVDAVRSVASMLTELESIWRGRIDRIDALLGLEAGAASDSAAHTPSGLEGSTTSGPEGPTHSVPEGPTHSGPDGPANQGD